MLLLSKKCIHNFYSVDSACPLTNPHAKGSTVMLLGGDGALSGSHPKDPRRSLGTQCMLFSGNWGLLDISSLLTHNEASFAILLCLQFLLSCTPDLPNETHE